LADWRHYEKYNKLYLPSLNIIDFADKDEFFGNRFAGAGALYNDYYHDLQAGNVNCMAPPGGANVLLQHHGPHVMSEHMSLPGKTVNSIILYN